MIDSSRERERQDLLLCFLAFVRRLKQSSLFSLVKAFAWWQMCDRSEVLVWISVLGTAAQRCTIGLYSSDVFLPRSVILPAWDRFDNNVTGRRQHNRALHYLNKKGQK